MLYNIGNLPMLNDDRTTISSDLDFVLIRFSTGGDGIAMVVVVKIFKVMLAEVENDS
jgi:hypothetical protein